MNDGSSPANLPVQLSTFVGRTRELEELRGLLASSRLVTLNGAGGCGKTRLAVQAASEARDEFSGGVWLAELAPVVDPERVAATIASSLGERDLSGDHVELIVDRLGDNETLLLVDNCEHLLGPAAVLIDTLLRRCPKLSVVATSREPLGIPGETAWRVPSLTTPNRDGSVSVESVSECDAVRLFCDRATKARSNFRLTDDNAAIVAQICHRLDGIPLAIELAAARVRGFTVAQIAAGLDDRFRLLTGGSRTVMPRQQTLQASVDWGFGLLSDTERAMFRRLAVFAGGFTLDAAEQVVAFGDVTSLEVLDVLLALVDKSMVTFDDDADRYSMLETLRQYATTRLIDAEEVNETRDRHLAWAASLFDPFTTRLRGDLRCVPLIASEVDNLRGAFEWAVSRSNTDAACNLASALMWWEGVRGDPGEACVIAERTLAMPEGSFDLRLIIVAAAILVNFEARRSKAALDFSDVALRALADVETHDPRVEAFAYFMTMFSGRAFGVAYDYIARAMELAEQAGDEALIEMGASMAAVRAAFGGRTREAEGYVARVHRAPEISVAGQNAMVTRIEVAQWTGKFAEAREYLDVISAIHATRQHPRLMAHNEATRVRLDLAQGCDSGAVVRVRLLLDEARRRRFISAVAVSGWAPIAWELLHGDIERAIDELVEWRNDSVPEGSFTGIWSHFPYEALVAAGRVADARAEFEKARADLPEAVAVRARCQLNVVEGLLGLAEGELADAEGHIYEALTEQHALGWRPALAHSLEGLAHVSACHRAHRDCARFAGAAQRLRHELGYVLRWPFEAQLLTSDLADARAELGDDGFDAAFTEGRALDDDAVVAYATRARGERGRPAFGWESLTPTEHSVAVLVAQGLTNKEVARELLMGAETVKTHVSRIYTKLGVPNRSALSAALAARDRAH